jgi:hypothetical protein
VQGALLIAGLRVRHAPGGLFFNNSEVVKSSVSRTGLAWRFEGSAGRVGSSIKTDVWVNEIASSMRRSFAVAGLFGALRWRALVVSMKHKRTQQQQAMESRLRWRRGWRGW